MASELPDTELRRRLKERGLDAGPITDSTRSLYQKKLDQLIAPVSAKNRRKSASPKAVHSGNFQPSLLEYSSEDSEIAETPLQKFQGSRRNSRRRTLPPGQLPVSIPKDLLAPGPSTSNDSAVFKVPTPISTGRSTRSRLSNISQEITSDCYVKLTRPKLKSSRSSLSSYDIESSDSDVDFRSRPEISGSRRLSPPSGSHSSKAANASNNVRIRLPSKTASPSPKFVENNLQDNHVGKQNGGQLDDSSFDGEFQVADSRHSSANYSHLISMFLVGLITLFFLVVGVLYVGVKQDGHQFLSSSSLENFTDVLCRGFTYLDCIKKEDFPLALKVTGSLYSIVSLAAGEHECSPHKRSSHWVSKDDIKLQLESLYPELKDEALMEKTLESSTLLIKKRPEWGIRILRDDGSQEVRAFEATKAHKSLWCRLKLAVQAVFYQIVIVSAVILAVLGAFVFGNLYKKRKKLHQQQVYELVEDIIDVLRDHHEKSTNNENNNADASVPIIHVRDTLIPPAERKEKEKMWNEAVRFLKENESRVLTEHKRLAGEEFLAWRWIQQTSPSGSKKSKVWQGQAFGSSGRGVNFLPFSPTPCLKIRNMFDPTMEFGENWQVTIQDAILEKCQGNNGIVHMVVDTKSKDGCVYIKFDAAEAAGQAYRALHGWWFDGKLLTVKYLRLERYLSRFPESANHTTPLKPSNGMQLSLQGGCSTSPLESS